MKTITGNCESSKTISLSKATKILSKFVSADNGASEVLNNFLNKASDAFDELNEIHKELKLSQSHRRNHRSRIKEDSGRTVESFVRSVDVKSENGSRMERLRDVKLMECDVKVSEEVNGFVGGGGGKGGKKDKMKKKLEFGDMEDDGKLDRKEPNEIELGRGDEERTNEGKKEKIEKKREKKDKNVEGYVKGEEKEIETRMSENGGIAGTQDLEIRSKKRHEVGSEKVKRKREKDLEVENEKRQEQHEEVERKLSNGVKSENGGLVDSRDIEIRSKKKYEAGSENKSNVEEVKTGRKKNRKNGDAEERSGELSKKKMKRKHEGYA